MRNLLQKLYGYFKYKKIDLQLGRWKIHHCDNINNIKSNLANIDHCGDKICGDPIKNKEITSSNNTRIIKT
tara:strand:+ start:2700 stop:2912 length:213 start_codon:yes stop_codon:yes gene_type:complete